MKNQCTAAHSHALSKAIGSLGIKPKAVKAQNPAYRTLPQGRSANTNVTSPSVLIRHIYTQHIFELTTTDGRKSNLNEIINLGLNCNLNIME